MSLHFSEHIVCVVCPRLDNPHLIVVACRDVETALHGRHILVVVKITGEKLVDVFLRSVLVVGSSGLEIEGYSVGTIIYAVSLGVVEPQ